MGRTVAERVLVATALLALLRGYSMVLSGARWWWLGFAVVAIVTATVIAFRMAGWARGAGWAGLAVAVLATSWLVAPDTARWGIPLPTRAITEIARGWHVIRVEEAPLAPPSSVILILVGSFALLVVGLDRALEAYGRAAIVAIAFVTTLAIPAMIAGSTPSWWVFAVPAAAWLSLLWLESAPAPSWASGRLPVAMGAVTLAGAMAFPWVAPRVEASSVGWHRASTSVFGDGVNPIVALGENLRRGSNRVVLRSYLTSSTPPYLRMATLSDFTGRTWRPTRGWATTSVVGADGGAREQHRERIVVTAADLQTSRVPVPYPTDRLSGLSQPVGIAPADLTARLSSSASVAGQTWTATYREQDYTVEELEGATTDGVGDVGEEYLRLPAQMPAAIARTARAQTSGLTNPYDRIAALQDWLRYDFSYSTSAPVEQNYDGTGVEVIAKFLRVKEGYCVHFASTLAVMARVLGIPSRIVVGYAPAESGSLVDGRRQYVTRANELHAWTEVHLGTAGWVQFDATPGIGTATEPRSDSEPVTSSPTSGATTQTTPTPRASSRPDSQESTRASASAPSRSPWRALWPVLAGLAVVVVALSPRLLRAARRRARWRRGRRDVEPLWAEIVDTSRDLGRPIIAAQTPAEFAGGLPGSGADRRAVTALLERVEASRFAPPGSASAGPEAVADAEQVVSDLRRSASRRSRILAAVWPRSLFSRGAGRPASRSGRGPSARSRWG